MNIKLNLTVEAINLILHALGELPAKTNAHALAMLIKTQAEPQVPQEEPQAQKEEPAA